MGKDEIVQLSENNGAKYQIPHTMDFYIIPRTEFLLNKVKEIESNLLRWYKENKYDQGDSYTVSITKKGKWHVSHSNDYPMQHGSGSGHTFSEDDFLEAMNVPTPSRTQTI